jgi:hypothetical protein
MDRFCNTFSNCGNKFHVKILQQKGPCSQERLGVSHDDDLFMMFRNDDISSSPVGQLLLPTISTAECHFSGRTWNRNMMRL